MSQGGSNQYYYRSEGQEDGPVSADKLLELFETHMLTAFDEVRRDGETTWQPMQQIVSVILESKKGAGRSRSGAETNAATEAVGNGASRVQPREQNVFVAQRGAPTPKAAGSITDADLAQSIAYANAEIRREWRIRGAVTVVALLVAGGLGLRYSADLSGGRAPLDTPLRVDTRITIENGTATMEAPRGTWTGTGNFSLARVRDVTFGSDGSVSMAVADESSRLRMDLDGGPDHNELKPGILRGRTLAFTASEEGWSAALQGEAATAKQALKLQALSFDNSALYPTRRMWPWPWQSWLVTAPAACSVLALDLEGCKSEITMKFRGFAECGAERCARLSFEGEWEGASEGDVLKVKLSGEILRSLVNPVDVSIEGNGTLSIMRTIVGPTSNHRATLAGRVDYSQQTAPAP